MIKEININSGAPGNVRGTSKATGNTDTKGNDTAACSSNCWHNCWHNCWKNQCPHLT